MSSIVPRTCTRLPATGTDRERTGGPRPLDEFRPIAAYVLLGDPGSGKTEAFNSECAATEEPAFLVDARDFLTLDPDRRPDWRRGTLFIDGLDEIRAGSADARTPFDRIRSRIDRLGRPRFRLSCRDADWLGENDRSRLASVSPDSRLTVLRLDPLTDADITAILRSRGDVGDPEAFMRQAREHGVGGLLDNPMNLRILAGAVAREGRWPESRLETFERACMRAVREHNQEHAVAVPGDDPDRVLDTAGRLCALQLLAGAAGYTLGEAGRELDYPGLSQCGSASPGVLRRALSTKLFRSAARRRFVPIHRQVAEFLGARHLARTIREGLPAGRVLALMTGEDGLVVTEMRGLSAWLAAHSAEARVDLIARDPVGVGLYGDIGRFSAGDRRALLEALGTEWARLADVALTAAPFAALAAPEMKSAVEEVLASPTRSREHQLLVEFVLRVAAHRGAQSGLAPSLLAVVRDATWWPRIHHAALDAYLNVRERAEAGRELVELLSDIRAGRVPDGNHELLGALLARLYPSEVIPSDVWDYFPATGDPGVIGRCFDFWERRLLEQSSPSDVAQLLDALAGRHAELWPLFEAHHLTTLPQRLLAVGVEAHGEVVGPERLHDWLGAGCPTARPWSWDYHGDSVFRIRSWLTGRPGLQKRIVETGLDRSAAGTGGRHSHALDVLERLYGATPPADFGLWLLGKAAALADTNPDIAGEIFEGIAWEYRRGRAGEGVSLDVLEKHARGNERFEAVLDRLLRPRAVGAGVGVPARERADARSRERERWLDELRANERAMRENRAAPALLHRLAQEYFDRFRNVRLEGGPGNIAALLGGDRELADAALRALRGVPDRDDLPDTGEILRIRSEGRAHYLGWPFLAGLAEAQRVAGDDPTGRDEERMRRAVAFYYCAPHATYEPEWYRKLIEARPEIVADIQVRFASVEFRRGQEHIYKLWELAHDPRHGRVARHAALPLLRAFPVRCQVKQLRGLDHLLWAALGHGDRAALGTLIQTKLSMKSLNVAQRVHWLAAGAVVSPREFAGSLEEFVRGRERRIRHLPAFFCPEDPLAVSLLDLETPVLELLVRLLGRCAGPGLWLGGGREEPVIRASTLVQDMVRRLAARSGRSAGGALERLLADPGLPGWRDELAKALAAQRTVHRDAGFRHSDIGQVCRTLDGGRPANAADLLALVADRLRELARTISRGNTDDWRQYWNWNRDARTPRHENLCRDALLSDLRPLLPEDVDAQSEGEYARDRRADIRVSCGDFAVPVEIKRNSHRDLWSALRRQLVEGYATAPEAGGSGIYVVLWFGTGDTQPHPSALRPDSPRELERQLAEMLEEDEARKICVRVIDVSGGPPDGSARSGPPRP